LPSVLSFFLFWILTLGFFPMLYIQILPAFPQDQLVVYCAPRDGLGVILTIIGFYAVCLVAASVLAFASRGISKNFNDAMSIAWLIWMTLFSCAVAALVGLLLSSSPLSVTLIIVFTLIWLAFLNCGITFGPLLYHLFENAKSWLPDLVTDSHANADGSRASGQKSSDGYITVARNTLADFVKLTVRLMDRVQVRTYIVVLEAELAKARMVLSTLNANEGILKETHQAQAKAGLKPSTMDEKTSSWAASPSNTDATNTTSNTTTAVTPYRAQPAKLRSVGSTVTGSTGSTGTGIGIAGLKAQNSNVSTGSSPPSRGASDKDKDKDKHPFADTSSPLLLGSGVNSMRRGTTAVAAPVPSQRSAFSSSVPITGGPLRSLITDSPKHFSASPSQPSAVRVNAHTHTNTPTHNMSPLPGAVLSASEPSSSPSVELAASSSLGLGRPAPLVSVSVTDSPVESSGREVQVIVDSGSSEREKALNAST
jgi:hypothetical protein